ncbi:hypothetical protein SAMN04488241_1054 [Sphingomonas rubra]|uniref:Uncharacterized protein n=2 Tax=Sphingomonas rubra TaxID=634430 RepID=A0A1I5S6P7_9SPHN|nr:hypothetical protein SAMN04488241_1054 [Sphingomonas rubra]
MCFIVGPIGDGGTETRKLADWLLRGLFKPVLEDESINFIVKRADEDADPGSISSALITDLINADLVIADLTGFNPNAFYELGIRHALQKPTIHVIAENVKLPFDNQDQRTIYVDISDFEAIENAKNRLKAAVLATQVHGYKVSNPVTMAGAITALKTSDDPKDRAIGDMEERLARLERDRIAEGIKGQGPLSTMTLEQARNALVHKRGAAFKWTYPINASSLQDALDRGLLKKELESELLRASDDERARLYAAALTGEFGSRAQKSALDHIEGVAYEKEAEEKDNLNKKR